MSADTIRLIAKEMRDFANHAHGNPPAVQITAKTLREYASALDTYLGDKKHKAA